MIPSKLSKGERVLMFLDGCVSVVVVADSQTCFPGERDEFTMYRVLSDRGLSGDTSCRVHRTQLFRQSEQNKLRDALRAARRRLEHYSDELHPADINVEDTPLGDIWR